MKIQVVVTRTDAGATTKLISNGGESSKNYASWDDALKEAEYLKLINTVEATAAKALPPGSYSAKRYQGSCYGIHSG